MSFLTKASHPLLIFTLFEILLPGGVLAIFSRQTSGKFTASQTQPSANETYLCDLLSDAHAVVRHNHTFDCSPERDRSGREDEVSQDGLVVCQCKDSGNESIGFYRLREDWHCSRISSGHGSAAYKCFQRPPKLAMFAKLTLPRITCTPDWYVNESSPCPSGGIVLFGDITFPPASSLQGIDVFFVYIAIAYAYLPFVVAAGIVLEFLCKFSTRSFAFLLFACFTVSFNEVCMAYWIQTPRPDKSCLQSCAMPSTRSTFSIGYFALRYLDALYRLWNQGMPVALSARRIQWRLVRLANSLSPTSEPDVHISAGHFMAWSSVWFFALFPVPFALMHLNDHTVGQVLASGVIGIIEAFVFFRIFKVLALRNRHNLGQRICCLKHDYDLPAPIDGYHESAPTAIEVSTRLSQRDLDFFSVESSEGAAANRREIPAAYSPSTVRFSIASDGSSTSSRSNARNSKLRSSTSSSYGEDRRKSSGGSPDSQADPRRRRLTTEISDTIPEETGSDDSWRGCDSIGTLDGKLGKKKSQTELLKAAIEAKVTSSLSPTTSLEDEQIVASCGMVSVGRELDILGSVLEIEEKMEDRSGDTDSVNPSSAPQSFLVDMSVGGSHSFNTDNNSSFPQASYPQSDEPSFEQKKGKSLVDLSSERQNFSLDVSGVFEHEDLTSVDIRSPRKS